MGTRTLDGPGPLGNLLPDGTRVPVFLGVKEHVLEYTCRSPTGPASGLSGELSGRQDMGVTQGAR